MMAQQEQHEQPTRRRGKGQTLVEFALTFPILLILLFGIVEFGRIFQAWVTLQNSARAAARYTTTGAYNADFYPLDTESLDNDLDSIVPCHFDDLRGTPRVVFDELYAPNSEGEDGVIIYDGVEGLYATWYQGQDCVPNIAEHQQRREDLARILSIYDEAYIGAAGLAIAQRLSRDDVLIDGAVPLTAAHLGEAPIGETQWDQTGTSDTEFRDFVTQQVPFYMIWNRTQPGPTGDADSQPVGYDTVSYFDVMICSGRGPENGGPGELVVANDDAEYPDVDDRFATVLEPDDPTVGGDARFVPACLLNEKQNTDDFPTLPHNVGRPWIDPGGPGDPITIVITFNHPLITPLGLAPYLQLQARRTAVNEAFRAAESVTSLPFLSPTGGGQPPGTETLEAGTPDPTEPQLDPDGFCETDTGDYVFRVTNNGGVATIGDIPYYVETDDGTRVDSGFIPVLNVGENHTIIVAAQDGPLTLVFEQASGTRPPGESTPDVSFEIVDFELDCQVPPTEAPLFECSAINIPVDALNNPLYGTRGAEFTVEWENLNQLPSRLLSVTLNWEQIPAYPGMFPSQMSLARNTYWVNGGTASTDPLTVDETTQGYFPGSNPSLLPGVRSVWAVTFANGPVRIGDFVSFYAFDGTTFTFENPLDSANPCVFTLDIPEPTVTPTRDPLSDPPTATPTPACEPGMIEVRLADFDIFGVVRVEVINRRNVVARMTGFDIQWIQHDTDDNLFLAEVRAGGNNPDLGTSIWESGASGQDNNPSTTGAAGGGGEGIWNLTYNFQPETTTNLWLDFNGGVGSLKLNDVYLASLADFNGSRFTFEMPVCAGGAGGPGGITTEDVLPDARNTPAPTNTLRPPPTQPNWTNTPIPPTDPPQPTDPPTAIPPTEPPPPTAPPTVESNVTVDFGGGGGGAD